MQKKRELRENRVQKIKKRIALTVIVWTVVIGVVLVLSAAIVGFLTNGLTLAGFVSGFSNKYTWYVMAAALACLIIYCLFDYRFRAGRRVKKVNNDLEDSHFLSDKEIRRAAGFTVTNLAGLSQVSDGIVLKCDLNKKKDDLNIVLRSPAHTLVIATTGTGKTQTFVSPSVEVLSRTKTQPSMVITDPKGELYEKHSKGLSGRGYNVRCIDLIDVYHSSRWNPFNDVLRKTELLRAEVTNHRGKYFFDGQCYLTYDEAERNAQERKRAIEDEIFSDIQDLIYTACPIEQSAHDKFWQESARNFIFALALAFWEDVRDGYMRPEQLTFYNLWRTTSDYCKGEMEELRAYFAARPKNSKTLGLANAVLVAEAAETRSSFQSNINQYMIWLSDGGITTLTSGNDIEFMDIDNQPTALFIKIPDERENRHVLVSIMIVQLYKALVYKARENEKKGVEKEAKLQRRVYFLMDEFGNLPKLSKMDSIVTVGRSRGIFMVPVIQDYAQLDNKYGKQVAETIRSNTNIKIFMGTTSKSTIEEFSALCGKKKVRRVSFNESKDVSISSSAQSEPLIYPSELENLNDPNNKVIGNSVILADGAPIVAHSSAFFESKTLFGAEEAKAEQGAFIRFNEDDMHYDIKLTANYLIGEKEEEALLQNPAELSQTSDVEPQLTEQQLRAIAEVKQKERFAKTFKDKLLKFKSKISDRDYDALAATDVSEAEFIIAVIEENILRAQNNSKTELCADLIKLKNFVLFQGAAEETRRREILKTARELTQVQA